MKITDVKSSPSKVKYFNALLHDGNSQTAMVSYNTSIHETLSAANLKERPVKVSNFLKRLDAFKNESVITMGDNSKAEYSHAVIPFAKVKEQMQTFNTFTSLREVVEKIVPEELVNVVGYATLINPTEEVQTKFGMKTKRDIELHDDDDQILKVTLWNNQIEFIKSDGNSQFKDLRVKCYNGNYLTSTSMSVIQPTTLVNYKGRNVLPVKLKTADFPPICIDQFEENYSCLKCKRKSVRSGDFVICESCNAKFLHNSSLKYLHLKASFIIEDGSTIVLTLPHQVVWPFFTMIGITVDDTQNDVEKALLTAKDFKVWYKNSTATEIKMK